MAEMPFRLLDLPPELRNRIYTCIIEDITMPPSTDVFSALQFLPDPTITAVSRQIRSESLGLFRQATTEFWSTHNFYLTIHRQISAQHLRFMLDMVAHPTWASCIRLHRLQVNFYYASGTIIDLTLGTGAVSGENDANGDEDGVRTTSRNFDCTNRELHLGKAFMETAHQMSVSLRKERDPQYVDVYGVLSTFGTSWGIFLVPAHAWLLA